MPPLAARAAGGGDWTWEANAGASPIAFVYVDRQCPHCAAELDRWEALAFDRGLDSLVWVVASPGSDMREVQWVPPSLRGRTLHDIQGSIAAELGIRAVPTTLWVDATDTVRIVHVGQSSRSMLEENILTITRETRRRK